MALASHIPQEVLDTVIAYLQDARETLRQCALVSRRWVYPCQNHLFRCLRIVLDPEEMEVSPIHRLKRILLRSPQLANHVRSVDVFLYDQESPTTAQQRALAVVLRYFPRLSKFELCAHDEMEFSSIDLALADALRTTLESSLLTSISLCGWKFKDLNHFVGLMGRHSRPLDSLVLRSISFSEAPNAVTHYESSSDSTAIQHLSVECSVLEHLMSWLAILHSPVAIKKLSLHCHIDDNAALLFRFLSPSLEEMVLSTPEFAQLPTTFDLGSLTKLRSLSIVFDDPDMHKIFESIPSNNVIENIIMTLFHANHSRAHHISYSTFSRHLASSYLFPRLKMVKIIIAKELFAVSTLTIKKVCQSMRSLVDKGLLCVEFSSGEALDSTQILLQEADVIDDGDEADKMDATDDADE